MGSCIWVSWGGLGVDCRRGSVDMILKVVGCEVEVDGVSLTSTSGDGKTEIR